MNKIILSILLLTLASFSSYARLIEEPRGCLKKTMNGCSLRVTNIPYHIKAASYNLNISAGSSVSIQREQLIPLEGNFWIESYEEIELATPYVKLKFKGNLWIEVLPDKTIVKNLKAENLQLLNVKKEVEFLPPGFENWYSGVDSNQQVVTGVMQPLPHKKNLKSWVQAFRVPKDKSIELVSDWKPLWKKNIEMSSEFYEQIAKEKISAQKIKEDLEAEQKAKRVYEQERLRKLYRSRHGVTDQGL